jgi:hypothetical protein
VKLFNGECGGPNPPRRVTNTLTVSWLQQAARLQSAVFFFRFIRETGHGSDGAVH